MRASSIAWVLVSVALAATGCESSDNGSPGNVVTPTPTPTATTPTPTPVVPTITLSPASGNLLTCGKVTATSSDGAPVTLSTNPAGVGTVDGSMYHAPNKAPSPTTFTLNATSGGVNASGAFTLATAFPKTAVMVMGSTTNGQSYGVFPHAIAARGSRSYAVWPTQNGTAVALMMGRSDDGGATWKAAAAAVNATLVSTNDSIDCASTAIDAANPDVVYAIARISGSNNLASAVGADGSALVLSVSGDGGATFTSRVLHVGGTADGPLGWDLTGICGDVVSPSADTVVVEEPGFYNGDGAPDMALWTDGARGAGFANGVVANNDYVANGHQLSLANVNAAADASGRLAIAQDGGTDDAGSATESPRLFTDGKGHTCVTYLGTLASTTNSYVQCSADAGKTFSALVKLDPADGTKPHSLPVGAFSADGRVAVAWTTGLAAGGQLLLAKSADGGATFGAPAAVPTYAVPPATAGNTVTTPTLAYDANGVLWVAYAPVDGGSKLRIAVDKSCDGGTTWSGAVLVNGPEANIADARWPAFALTAGDAPRVFAVASDRMVTYALAP